MLLTNVIPINFINKTKHCLCVEHEADWPSHSKIGSTYSVCTICTPTLGTRVPWNFSKGRFVLRGVTWHIWTNYRNQGIPVKVVYSVALPLLACNPLPLKSAKSTSISALNLATLQYTLEPLHTDSPEWPEDFLLVFPFNLCTGRWWEGRMRWSVWLGWSEDNPRLDEPLTDWLKFARGYRDPHQSSCRPLFAHHTCQPCRDPRALATFPIPAAASAFQVKHWVMCFILGLGGKGMQHRLCFHFLFSFRIFCCADTSEGEEQWATAWHHKLPHNIS